MSCPKNGDAGVQLVYQLINISVQPNEPLNISLATDLKISLRDPNGVTRFYSATLLTDGTDGKLYYTTQIGDLYMPGQWYISARVQFGGGTSQLSGDPLPLQISDAF